MHELRRRAYLHTLGIDSYISRAQLSGAAPSQRLIVVRQPLAAEIPVKVNPSAKGRAPLIAVELGAAAAEKPQNNSTTASLAQEVPEKTQSVSIPTFTVAAIACGGWLWVEELSQPEISRDQVHLVKAMVRALGLPDNNLEVSRFDWPIHRNAQLDLGEEAARASLSGFVQRKAAQEKCRGMVLLGDACQKRLDSQQLGTSRCVNTISSAQMLVSPNLKKQVWQDLQAMVRKT